jgi:hypothetical protein
MALFSAVVSCSFAAKAHPPSGDSEFCLRAVQTKCLRIFQRVRFVISLTDVPSGVRPGLPISTGSQRAYNHQSVEWSGTLPSIPSLDAELSSLTARPAVGTSAPSLPAIAVCSFLRQQQLLARRMARALGDRVAIGCRNRSSEEQSPHCAPTSALQTRCALRPNGWSQTGTD